MTIDQHPMDLSQYLDSWLHQSSVLAESCSVSEIVSQLQTITERLRFPGFRLAVVGEFSRGKSTLLNRLLERELLPTRALPTTATLTTITPGTEDSMVVSFDNSPEVHRAIDAASWNDLLITNSEGKDQKVLAKVQLTLVHPWLEALDAELIDTPGIGELNTTRAAIVFDLLSQCDATVLLVSATLPFSMTEAAFLEQEVIGKHIPRIIVIISKLDTIQHEQQEEVIAVTRERIAQISADIPVLPSYPVDENTSETEAIEAVRSQITAMVAGGNHKVWRSQQVAKQLIDILTQLIDIGSVAIASAVGSAAEHEQALKKAKTAMRTAELQWEQIRLELDRRRIQHGQTLKENLFSSKSTLIEVLNQELSQTDNPKTWWECKLPLRLRRELFSLGQKSEEFLLQEITDDFDWLTAEVSRIFSTQMTQQPSQTQENLEIKPNLPQLEMSPIQRYRWLTRLGGGVTVIGSYLTGGAAVMAIALSLGAAILSEQFLSDKLEEQRQQVQKKLELSVDKAFNEYYERIFERLRQLYQQVAEDTQRQQVIWHSAKTAAIEVSHPDSDEQPWQQMLDKASALKQEILAAVETSNH
ncbi:MAG: dynamin family protein [Stigonema ocellatum SAG 48.90 = DSM 106950]|nr:dynamin family protein [Stigonema ocellatum SAG 48.90 = DSM 106950]